MSAKAVVKFVGTLSKILSMTFGQVSETAVIRLDENSRLVSFAVDNQDAAAVRKYVRNQMNFALGMDPVPWGRVPVNQTCWSENVSAVGNYTLVEIFFQS